MGNVCNVPKERKSEVFVKLESTRDESGLTPKESKEIFGNPIIEEEMCKIRDNPSDVVNSISDAKVFIKTHKEINEKDREIIEANIKKVEEELPSIFNDVKVAEEVKSELENVKKELNTLPGKKGRRNVKSIKQKLEGKYNMRAKNIDFWFDNWDMKYTSYMYILN